MRLKSVYKSILIGGAAAGFISLIPLINIFNLIFMIWMAVGGGVGVYLLLKDNDRIKISDSLWVGLSCGVLGWAIFAVFSFLLLSTISVEKIERVMKLVEIVFPSAENEETISEIVEPSQLKSLFLLVLGIAMLFSIFSGALGGLLSRYWFQGKRKINCEKIETSTGDKTNGQSTCDC